MVEINRVWLNVDTDTNKITLFSRPRVSIRVDEYIWSLIEEHIVKPHKLMRSEKHKYLLKIAFGRFDSVRHRYYPLSPYSTDIIRFPRTTGRFGKASSRTAQTDGIPVRTLQVLRNAPPGSLLIKSGQTAATRFWM